MVMVAIFSALVSREALEDSGIRKTKIHFGAERAKLKRSDFLVMSVTTTILFKKKERKKGLSTRVQRPQASLFNLMLTAFDVVICHLLIGQHLPQLQKERKKEKELKQHLVTCIIWFPLLVLEGEKKTKIPCRTAFFFFFFANRSTTTFNISRVHLSHLAQHSGISK